MGRYRTGLRWTREHLRPVAAVGVVAVVATAALIAVATTPTSPVPVAASVAPPMSAGERASFHRFVAAAIPATTAAAAAPAASAASDTGYPVPGRRAGWVPPLHRGAGR